MTSFTATAVQFDPKIGPSTDGTLERMVEHIRSVNTDLVVFPELATTGYTIFDQLPEIAESIPGPTTDTLGAAAARANTHVLFGMPATSDSGVTNSAVWIDRDGDVLTRYNKVHRWGRERESYEQGDSYCVVDADIGRIGVQICYDLNFPEASLTMAREEVDLIVNLSAWSVPMASDWHRLLPGRAIENGSHLLGCNRAGHEGETVFCGASKSIAPDGTVLNKLDHRPGTVTMTVDQAELDEEHERNPMRIDRKNTRKVLDEGT